MNDPLCILAVAEDITSGCPIWSLACVASAMSVTQGLQPNPGVGDGERRLMTVRSMKILMPSCKLHASSNILI